MRDKWHDAFMDESSRAYYDSAYAEANYAGTRGRAINFAHRMLERPFGPGDHFSRVIEVGSGHGEHIGFVRHGFDEYVMTDLNDHVHSLPGRPQDAGVRSEIADAQALHHADASFDRLVCAPCLLHHLPDADRALKEWRRVVRPGGTISIYLPSDPGMLYRAVRWGTTHRYQRKLEREGRLKDHLYLWAREHPNHVLGLRQLIRVNFAKDGVDRKVFPFPMLSWNWNFFEVYRIRVADESGGQPHAARAAGTVAVS